MKNNLIEKSIMQNDTVQRWLNIYKTRLTRECDFVCEHYIVVSIDLHNALNFRIVIEQTRANALAYSTQGVLFKVCQDTNNEIQITKCKVRRDKNIMVC